MVVTESGIITDVKLEQPWNAYLPMVVTESGIITDVTLALSWTVTEGIAYVLAL